jgi:hypothetical protein
MAEIKQGKRLLSPEDLADLAKLATTKEWGTLCRTLDIRVSKDKNSIVTYPVEEPIKLATMHAFYKGRISACYLIKREVNEAAKTLEGIEEKPKKEK